MFTQVWKKYLPVILILLKRSATGEQMLHMNRSDFERAAGGRKLKYNFSLVLTKGKAEINANAQPLSKDLASLLLEDQSTRPLILEDGFKFNMGANFQLTIRRIEMAGEEPVQQ
jgi:hypothetical protein